MEDLTPAALAQLKETLTAALARLGPERSAPAARFQAAAERFCAGRWRVLVAGLRSVGKSSFVGALWGDAEMLPTAVRDCTQTNTLIRPPASGEPDRGICLSYLPRAQVVEYALRDATYYRLTQMLHDTAQVLSAELEEQLPEARLRAVAAAVRRLFEERPKLLVLHEELTDDLEELEQLLAFLDSPAYQPGVRLPARWEDRSAHLMGRRRSDGRTVEAGRLRALEHVEITRSTPRWPADVPQLIDTPWVPAYHEARRAELILRQAQTTDVLVLLSLPERFEPEEWVVRLLAQRPEMARRVVVVFNQIDTVDAAALYARDGFAATFAANSVRLARLGILPENLLMSCARLPFLQALAQDQAVRDRTARLRAVLGQLTRLAQNHARDDFTRKFLAACDPDDAGLHSFEAHLKELRRTAVWPAQTRAALAAWNEIPLLDIPEANRRPWQDLRAAAKRTE